MAGTRFLLQAKFDDAVVPERVMVSSPAGSLRAGPRDRRMHVTDPAAKPLPYDPPGLAPPWRGPALPPAQPDAFGHFDHIHPGTRPFLSAHLFGTVRHTLDVWERYLGFPLRWWHAATHPSLELIPVVQWPNAQSGLGFIETGLWPVAPGQVDAFALNADVIAHEVGHAIIFGVLGVPRADRLHAMYLGLHEAVSDLVALLTALHYASVRRVLLRETGGDLYGANVLTRIGELSKHSQIRLASNKRTMAEVADLSLGPDGDWVDPSGQGRNAHALAEPFTGAVFDILVDIYQSGLVRRGLALPGAHPDGWSEPRAARGGALLRARSRAAMLHFALGFERALIDARDALGVALARMLTVLDPSSLVFDEAASVLLDGLARQGRGDRSAEHARLFSRRGISALRAPNATPRSSAGTIARPPTSCGCHGPSDRRTATRACLLIARSHHARGSLQRRLGVA